MWLSFASALRWVWTGTPHGLFMPCWGGCMARCKVLSLANILLELICLLVVLSIRILCAFVTQDGNVVVVVLVLRYRLPHRYRTWILHAMLGATRMQRFELSMLHTS